MKKFWPGYATPSEAARRLGISRQRVNQLIDLGRLSHEWVDERRLIKLSDLDQFAQTYHPVIRPEKSGSA